ncbi:TniB family NTP-binding protein [Rhizobium sp. BR 315]|uniref:TniB family NTP-binding protein n=1 Tax=Rhizobium sp. BR 315 TaxID=3040014 RepID=UPI003D342857
MDASSALDELDFFFKNMGIRHLFMKRAHQCFDRLRASRRRIISGEGFATEANCATLFAGTQSGKSTTVREYMRASVVDYCYEIGLFPPDTPRNVVVQLQRKVIYVSVSGTSTLMSLLEDILRAFGDPKPQRGTQGNKKERILNYITEFGTELLIFDEMNHLKIGAQLGSIHNEATRVHNTLKDFLLGGCPVVFVGTAEAEKKVFSDLQIRARCKDRLFIGPLKWNDKEHQATYKEYCALLGLELKSLGLFPARSNFITGATPRCLFFASGGYFGHTTNIVALAARYALEEGAENVGWRHLSAAAAEYAIFNGLAKYNLFEREELEQKQLKAGSEEAAHA